MAKRRRRERRVSAGVPATVPAADVSQLLDVLRVIARGLGAVALRLAPSRPKTNKDRVQFLRSLGFDRNEIAGMLDIAPHIVSVRMSESRGKAGGKRGRSGTR